MKNLRKTVIMSVMLLAFMLAGCSIGDLVGGEVAMKEFISEDGTVHINMKESWELDTEDMGAGSKGCVVAFNESGSEGMVVLQLAKDIYGGDIADMDALKAHMQSSYPMSDMEKVENPDIAGMDHVETYSCKLTADGQSCDGRILYGETDYAYYSILYLTPKIFSIQIEYFNNVCLSFREIAPEAESLSYASDTIQWFNNACAILTAANGWDYTIFGGLAESENSKDITQSLLSEWWEVTDRQTADETLDWLLTEGHRAAFAKDMQDLEGVGIADVSADERIDFMLEHFDMDEDEARNYAVWYTDYAQSGMDAIAGWDYSRAMSLLGNYYLAGYYTREEALDKALDTAKIIQPIFGSWDEFMESYFVGYEYWAGESSEDRREIYDDIKEESDSIYNLDWNASLEKDW